MPESTDSSESYAAFVSPGMPALAMGGRAFSRFEFWPAWVMYFPVVLQWLLLAIRHRSLTLPLLANPRLPLAGMVGVPKSLLLAQARGECRDHILPWFVYQVNDRPLAAQAREVMTHMETTGLAFPVVCKPDIGCRGAGVKRIEGTEELEACLRAYPPGAGVLVQKLSRHEAEAGIFYVREPGNDQGRVISLALKYTPYVVGDGVHTLKELIVMDARAGKKPELYLDRHARVLDTVIPRGEPYRLIFSASHCRGAVFRNGGHLITLSLTEKINALMASIPDFYYGRLDVKFSSVEALCRGEDLEIMEINAASSEPLHIWDRNTTLREAVRFLLWQYRLLFRLGRKNRRRGYGAPGILALLRGWLAERRLSRYYPDTD